MCVLKNRRWGHWHSFAQVALYMAMVHSSYFRLSLPTDIFLFLAFYIFFHHRRLWLFFSIVWMFYLSEKKTAEKKNSFAHKIYCWAWTKSENVSRVNHRGSVWFNIRMLISVESRCWESERSKFSKYHYHQPCSRPTKNDSSTTTTISFECVTIKFFENSMQWSSHKAVEDERRENKILFKEKDK